MDIDPATLDNNPASPLPSAGAGETLGLLGQAFTEDRFGIEAPKCALEGQGFTKRFLVTGGAGYVGSHLVGRLVEHGAEVVVVDDLRSGHRAALPPGVRLVETNIGNTEAIDALLAEGSWHAVFHFAGLTTVGESMAAPMQYLQQNVSAGFALIDACVRHKVERFVFSSTANLFGDPERVPIDEETRINPSSPYGESKRMIEQALRWVAAIHGMRYACLRYFNAAGADPAGRLGEDHDPETHLIPLVIDAALDRRGALTVFGDDYPTADGTCLRDYVHVTDLAEAHLSVLKRLDAGSVTCNVGSGTGHSVLEVIAAVEAVSGRKVPYRLGERRPGDPGTLVAASNHLKRETGWKPRYDKLEDIVRTAYAWRLAHPRGYDDR